MIEMFTGAAILVIIGAALGIVAVIAVGIRREERNLSLTSDTTGRIARGTRRLNGVYTRDPGIIEEVSLHRQGRWPPSRPGSEVAAR
jgi:hypothetical protein